MHVYKSMLHGARKIYERKMHVAIITPTEVQSIEIRLFSYFTHIETTSLLHSTREQAIKGRRARYCVARISFFTATGCLLRALRRPRFKCQALTSLFTEQAIPVFVWMPSRRSTRMRPPSDNDFKIKLTWIWAASGRERGNWAPTTWSSFIPIHFVSDCHLLLHRIELNLVVNVGVSQRAIMERHKVLSASFCLNSPPKIAKVTPYL